MIWSTLPLLRPMVFALLHRAETVASSLFRNDCAPSEGFHGTCALLLSLAVCSEPLTPDPDFTPTLCHLKHIVERKLRAVGVY